MVLCGGVDGTVGAYSLLQNELDIQFSVGSPATRTIWAGSNAIVETSSGLVNVYEEGREISSFSAHAGEVTALAIHPSGEILASVGVDKSFTFYDLNKFDQVLQIYTGAGKLFAETLHGICVTG